jgi:hypothetical protein
MAGGNVEASSIAYWANSTWHDYGAGIAGGPPGLGSIVYDLQVTEESLYACGQFTKAGNHFSSGVARWSLESFTGEPHHEVVIREADLTKGDIATRVRSLGDGADIYYSLAEQSQVQLEVFDIAGRAILVLADEGQQKGDHVVTWNGLMGNGKKAPAGIYVLRLNTEGMTKTAKLVLYR